MTPRSRDRLTLLALLLLLAAGVFSVGCDWGLPSRATDRYLFGDRTPWTGAEILKLSGGFSDDARRGADVDANPLAHRDRPLVLNETDQARAEIALRYRLFTYQPDEMLTIRALAGMRPGEGKLDPKLYQYGGLWIYPVGALLKAASIAKLATITPDLAFYLDRPTEIGRFYVLARLYSAAWGVIGVAVVFHLARRLGGTTAGAIAALLTIAMPVVINMAHEAKPHLPGAVLMLTAVLAAARYVETGAVRRLLLTGLACGAAFGMVVSSLLAFAVVPAMVCLRPQSWGTRVRHVLIAGAAGIGVYAITNPYVFINLFANPAVLKSNLGTSVGMYSVGRWYDGILNAGKLIAEGASPVVAVAGAVIVFVALIRFARRWRPEAWLLAAPGLLVLGQFVALGAGKPGEYGRFAIVPDVCLAIAVAAAAARVRHTSLRIGTAAALVLSTAVFGGAYLAALIADARPTTSRLAEADRLQHLLGSGARTLALTAEPAPYSMPPVDLFRWKIVLLPRGAAIETSTADVTLRATDDVPPSPPALPQARDLPSHSLPTRISWAAKPFEVRERGGGR